MQQPQSFAASAFWAEAPQDEQQSCAHPVSQQAQVAGAEAGAELTGAAASAALNKRILNMDDSLDEVGE